MIHSPSPPTFNICVLPGDGIGVDVTREAVRVLEAVMATLNGLQFAFQTLSVGAGEFLQSGNPLPAAALDACAKADAVLLGAMGLPNVRWPDGREMTPQIDLRDKLDLYAGPRPIKLYHGNDSPLKGYQTGEIDFVIVRQNTEGLFSTRLSVNPTADDARDVLHLTRKGCERVIRFAFELARKRRRHCTLVDKANVFPSMVFFRRIFDEIAERYPDVATERVYLMILRTAHPTWVASSRPPQSLTSSSPAYEPNHRPLFNDAVRHALRGLGTGEDRRG